MTRESADWEIYKKIRNKYKQNLDKTECNYIKNKINAANDQKCMWKI